MTMGCSTNAIIHLVAMSRRAGAPCAVNLDDFDAASRKVPVLANIRPSGDTYRCRISTTPAACGA
jgi:dihydroxyacid dehydratase/phosphogluconate dehydratase